MSRNGKINRDFGGYVRSERVSWLDEFANNIQEASTKTAVEVARDRQELSIQDQIRRIMGNPSGRTVASVVQELQERTGLKQYLHNTAQMKTDVKTAEEQLFPGFSEDVTENIKSFIENNIKTHRGQITVPAVQYEILANFRSEGVKSDDVNNERIASYINKMIAREQGLTTAPAKNPQLGAGVGVLDMDGQDEGNADFMAGLMPVTD